MRFRASRVQVQASPWQRTKVSSVASVEGAVRADIIGDAEQPRRVGEIGDLGQKALDLDFRMHAGLQPAIDFQRELFAKDQRRYCVARRRADACRPSPMSRAGSRGLVSENTIPPPLAASIESARRKASSIERPNAGQASAS